jgi:TolB-like protein
VYAAVSAASIEPSKPVLAVLAFDNLSSDADLLYFSDGVSEEILYTVGRTAGLSVIGRSSSFQYRGPAKNIRRIASELGVTHVLDGSVRRAGDRVRITTQLVESEGQTTLWTQRYDRDLGDVFALQDEIAAAVAAALKLSFAPGSAKGPIDPVAYDLYLKARATNEHWLGAADTSLLEQALARAPDLAAAWAMLALTRAIETQAERDPAKIAATRAQAQAAADRATSLDPGAGIAYVARSLLHPICGAYGERDALLRKALAANPDDPLIRLQASRFYSDIGFGREACEHSGHAYQVDPLFAQGANQHALMLAFVGRVVESDALFDATLGRWPAAGYTALLPMFLAATRGNWRRAAWFADYVRAVFPLQPEFIEVANYCEQLRDWSAETTESTLSALQRQLDATGTLTPDIALLCRHGAAEAAYELLDRASFVDLFKPEGRFTYPHFHLHWLFNGSSREMRESPRFVKLCHRLGLVAYWAAKDRWPDCAAEVAPFYDFRAEAKKLLGSAGLSTYR